MGGGFARVRAPTTCERFSKRRRFPPEHVCLAAVGEISLVFHKIAVPPRNGEWPPEQGVRNNGTRSAGNRVIRGIRPIESDRTDDNASQ